MTFHDIMTTLKINNLRIILVVFLLIFLSIFLFFPNRISGGDIFFPPNLQDLGTGWTWSWLYQQNLGFFGITYHNAGLFYFLYALFAFLPQSLLEKILLVLIFFTAFISMYYLFNQISTIPKSVAILASLLYTINPFSIILLPQFTILIAYALLPLYLAVTIKLSDLFNKRNIALLFLVNFFSILCFSNPPAYLILWLAPMFYLVYRFLLNPTFEKIKIACVVLISIIIVNFTWIFQYFIYLTYAETSFISSGSTLQAFSLNANIGNIFNLLGAWSFDKQAFGCDYYPYFGWYYSGVGILIATLLVMFVIVGICNKNNFKNRDYVFFVGIFFISIFLAKGPNPPAGAIFTWFFDHISIFQIFREPWTKFMPLVVLSYAILFGYGITFISDNLKKIESSIINKKPVKRLGSIFFWIIFILIVVYSWPFFTGSAIPGDRGNFPGLAIEIPQYWNSASGYINLLPKDGRVLLLPENPFYQMHYFWWGDGYYGTDPTPYFIFKSIINSEPGGGYVKPIYSTTSIKNFYSNYLKGNYPLWKPLSLMNTKYILHRKDLDWTQIGTVTTVEEPKIVTNRLNNESYIHPIASFGTFETTKIVTDQWFLNKIVPDYPYLLNESVLDLYEISDDHFLPHIYSVNMYVFTGNMENTFNFIGSDAFTPGESIIFTNDTLTNQELTGLSKIPAFRQQVPNQSIDLSVNNAVWKNTDQISLRTQNSVSYYAILCKTPNCNTLATSPSLDMMHFNATTSMSVNEYHPVISFQKVNPTKYEVCINATQPFFLVFSESYHPQWKAYVEKNPVTMNEIIANYSSVNVQEARQEMQFTPGDISYLLAEPLPEDHHFLVNGYANAWYIDPAQLPKDSDGNINITLYFWPQSLFYLGLIISGTTLLCCIGYLVYDWRKRKNENND